MSWPSSPVSPAKPEQQQTAEPAGGRCRGRRRFWLVLALMAVLVALTGLASQWLNRQQHTMTPGRPLSYPQTHLHTVVMSTRPGVVYLGTHYGIFTSTNGGYTWPQSQGGLNTSMVTAIAVSPSNPDLLAVLAVPTSGLSGQMGVYVSANAGRDWHFTAPAGLPATAYPYTIQSATGVLGHFYVFFSYIGWFETQDLGQHWRAITSGTPAHLQTPSLLTDPGNPAHLLIGGDLGLFETRDDGLSWQQINGISENVFALAATTPTDSEPRTILAATEEGLYRWQDGQDAQAQIVPLRGWPASSPPTRLVINSNGSALYALSGSDLWFSADQGTTWQHRWRFARSDLVSLDLNPANDQELLAGFFAPPLVLLSNNAGKGWQTLTH